MLSKIKIIYTNIWAWMEKNPKAFYKYAMFILIPLFIISLYFSYKHPHKIYTNTIPIISTRNVKPTIPHKTNRIVEPIINELIELKSKHETIGLNSEDSLRIKYLINRYNELK